MRVLLFLSLLVLLTGNICVAAVITADVAVEFPGGQYAPLQADEFLDTNWHKYYWYDMPAFVDEGNFLFWQLELTGFPNSADGITTFEVLSDGPVLMAVTTRWGGGGNSSGDWIPELTTREELEQQGWVEFATGLTDSSDDFAESYLDYIVFRRDSLAGEVFTYRTEKYRPPTLIRSEVTAVPEPSTIILLLTGALGLLVYRIRRR